MVLHAGSFEVEVEQLHMYSDLSDVHVGPTQAWYEPPTRVLWAIAWG